MNEKLTIYVLSYICLLDYSVANCFNFILAREDMLGHVKSVQSNEFEYYICNSHEWRSRYKATSHQEHASCKKGNP